MTNYSLMGFGAVLAALGIFLPADQLISFLRGTVAAPDLQSGAWLFKIGLIVIGIYAALLSFLPRAPVMSAPRPLAPATGMETGLFLALIVIATALRLYSLDVGIWFDEMQTHVNYMPLTIGQLVSTFNDANNHMLFSIFARSSLSIFGDSVWAFRLPAVLFGVGSIAAIYYLARRVTTTKEALFSAALLAVSFHHIWFSQNARGYTALLFFTLVSSALLIDAIRKNRRRDWLAYAIAAFLGAYTHLTMGFAVLAHFFIFAACMIRTDAPRGLHQLNGLFFGFILVTLLTFQGYALILPNVLGGGLLNSGLQSEGMEWTNPVWAIMEVVNGLQVGFAGAGVGLIAAGVFALGFFDYLRKGPAVAFLFAIPVGTGLLIMTSIGYTLFPRFFFFEMGFGVIIVMRGAVVIAETIGRMAHLTRWHTGLIASLFCAGIVSASLLSLRYVYVPKQAYAEAIAFVEAEAAPGDPIVAIGIADFPLNTYYAKGWAKADTLAELDAATAQNGTPWLIYTMPLHAKSAYPEIFARINKNYSEINRFYGTLNGGDVVVLHRN